MPEPALLGAVRQAVSQRLLVAASDGYTFPHAVTRQSLRAAAAR